MIIKLFLAKILIFFLSLLGVSGLYIPATDTVICSDEISCIHEEGHRLDFRLEQPSQTEEFKEYINNFPFLEDGNNSCIIKNDYCFYSEAYANLYEAVKGDLNNLPPDARIFYEVIDG
jgi:hypothetical protein